ncbi:uncharacterized protein METZ01_LOCUS171400, partial [marine metagenome]
MKFIIIDNKSGRHRSFGTNGFLFGVALVSLLSIPASISYFSYRFGVGEAELNGEMVEKWHEVLEEQKGLIEKVKWEAE